MTIKPTPFRLAFSFRFRPTVIRFFKSATEITAWVFCTEIQTMLIFPSALIQLANVAAQFLALSLYHNHLQITGTFALKFILILRQELRTLAQLHSHMSTVKN